MQAGDKISFCSYDGRVLDALRFDDNIKNYSFKYDTLLSDLSCYYNEKLDRRS